MSVEVVPSRSLTEVVRDASLCCFSPCFVLHVKCHCQVRSVIARDARSLFVCARDTSVCCDQGFEFAFRVDPIMKLDVLIISESSQNR